MGWVGVGGTTPGTPGTGGWPGTAGCAGGAGRGLDGSRSLTSMFPSGREMSTWSAVIASTRPPAIVSPMRYPATRFVSGSSRYAIGFVSRRTTPCRFGFDPPRRAPVVAVAGASLRVGLKRLRLAMTLYALTGAWGTGGRAPAGPPGGVTGRGRPGGGGGPHDSDRM